MELYDLFHSRAKLSMSQLTHMYHINKLLGYIHLTGFQRRPRLKKCPPQRAMLMTRGPKLLSAALPQLSSPLRLQDLMRAKLHFDALLVQLPIPSNHMHTRRDCGSFFSAGLAGMMILRLILRRLYRDSKVIHGGWLAFAFCLVGYHALY